METKVIKCQGLELVAPQPYAEGHVLLANEAQVLNQTYTENLRNNFASRIRSAAEAAEKAGETYAPDMDQLQAEFDAYVAEYQFGVRRSGGGSSASTLDPVEREARKMAEAKVKAAIQAKGHKIKDVPKEKLAELTEKFYSQNLEALTAQAQTVVDAQNAIGDMDFNL